MRHAHRLTIAAIALLSTACTAPDSTAPAKFQTEALTARSDGPVVQHIATVTLPVLATVRGVTVIKGGLGSAVALVPGTSRDFYFLTDRGPNVDGSPTPTKIFAVPGYTPTIYRAHIAGSELRIDQEIPLKRPNGTPLT